MATCFLSFGISDSERACPSLAVKSAVVVVLSSLINSVVGFRIRRSVAINQLARMLAAAAAATNEIHILRDAGYINIINITNNKNCCELRTTPSNVAAARRTH